MNNSETSSPDVAGEIPPALSDTDISSANTPADSSEEQVKLYYVFRGDVEEGPYTEEMLKMAADSGQVLESTYVRCEGMTEWQTYGQVFAASLPVEESQATLSVRRLKETGDACMQTARQFAEKMLPFSKKIGEQALGKVKQGMEAVQNMDLKESYDKLQNHELTARAKGMVDKYLPNRKRKYAAGIALVVLAGVAALCLTSPHEENAVAAEEDYFNCSQDSEDNEQIDVKELQIDAEQGNVDSQYKMGVLYFKGIGVEKDLKAAAQWWKKAAEQGHGESAYLLGAMYANGFTLQSDEKANDEAIRWYTFAAEQGNARALYELGMRSLSGDSKSAVKLLEASAEQGYHEASFILGCLYFKGEYGVRQHIGKAKFYFQKAAEQGNGAAVEILSNIKNLY